MNIYYNPLQKKCKSILGGIRLNEELEINVFGTGVEPCILVLYKDGGEARYFHMQKTVTGWTTKLNFSDVGLYFYYFIIGGKKAGVGKFRDLEFKDNAESYQILVFSENFSTPKWFHGGVMYQIFPDRFCKSGEVVVPEGKWLHKSWNEMPEFRPDVNGKILNNDFFGGNLKGITEKLNYLKQLGVTVIYLNPIFKAYSNHRYDTGDYMQIDPILGNESDFSELVQTAKHLGIKIILDGVFNHTGDDSRYFNKYGNYDEVGAYQSQSSKFFSWYTFRRYPDKYDCWWGIDVLPAVNENNSEYIDFITGESGVLSHWMKRGVSGFRLDVADELPDEFIEKIRERIKSCDENAILIGEVWEDASNKIAYGKRRKYFQGKELDSVMNYPLKDAIIDLVLTKNTDLFRETIAYLRDNYPKCVLDSLMNILGTHDTSRILTVLGGKPAYNKEEMSNTIMSDEEKKQAIERLKIAAILQFTLFGIPCIYYGDETGAEGYSDPFCRQTLDWQNINQDLLSFYKKLGLMRNMYRNLFINSEYSELYANERCIIFERKNIDEQIIVAVNFSNSKIDLKYQGILFDQISGEKFFNRVTISSDCVILLGNKKI